jgi:membrane associated rhomboid family serine protease
MSIFDNLTITLLIIVFTGLMSYQGFSNYHMIDRWKHYPYRESRQKEWYRLLTSGFVHADWIHLLINMYVLFSFGSYIESNIVSWYGNAAGRLIFLLVYLLNIILANIPTTIRQIHNPGFSSIGASGAISGLLFMTILFNPWSMFQLFFIVPIPAVLLGAGYLIYSSMAANKGQGRLDHSAHFAGALAGMALIILIHPEIVGDFFRKLASDFPLR